MTDKSAAVIGGGPAGLMAAEVLARGGVRVTLYERMPSLGRKFLLAGRGGLNLTHSEELPKLLARYGNAAPRLQKAIADFDPISLRSWCEKLGQPTFVGTSGRVFPKAMKTSPLLRAWLRRLGADGVVFRPRCLWTGWNAQGHLTAQDQDGPVEIIADAVVLALGGASWPHLGSDGGWVSEIARQGIAVTALQPANCGFLVAWSDVFRARYAGHPLKRIALRHGDANVRGEALITEGGIEGGAIYALAAPLRETIAAQGQAVLDIDLRPDVPASAILEKLAAKRGKKSLKAHLMGQLRLSAVDIGLLQEATAVQGQKLAELPADAIARLIKAVPVTLTGLAPIARAISTAGGIALDEIDDAFMLKRKPGVFVAGELLDWEAPTGGYLLQAAFATGAAAGKGALAWLQAPVQPRV